MTRPQEIQTPVDDCPYIVEEWHDFPLTRREKQDPLYQFVPQKLALALVRVQRDGMPCA